MKYLSANKCTTGQEKKPYVAWKWSAQMDRFKRFVKHANTQTNVSLQITETDGEPTLQEDLFETTNTYNIEKSIVEDRVEDDPEEAALENSEFSVSTENEQPRTRKRKVATMTNTDKVLKYLEGKHRKEMDDIDYIMLGFSKSIKKLSRKRQILAKKRITEIITELELEELDDCSLPYSDNNSGRSSSLIGSPSTSRFPLAATDISNDNASIYYQSNTVSGHDQYEQEDCSMTVFNSFKML